MLSSYDTLDLTVGIRVMLLLGHRFIFGDVTLQRVCDGYVSHVKGFFVSPAFFLLMLVGGFFQFLSSSFISFPLLLHMCFQHGFLSEFDP